MKNHLCPGAVLFPLLFMFAAAGCQEVGTTAGIGVATVETGAESLRQGAGQLGNIATLGIFERLGTGKQRSSLLREVRDLRAHMSRLERYLTERRVRLAPKDDSALRRADENIASARRRLREKEFSRGDAREIYGGLDRARGTFNLIHQRYGAPRYTGHVGQVAPN